MHALSSARADQRVCGTTHPWAAERELPLARRETPRASVGRALVSGALCFASGSAGGCATLLPQSSGAVGRWAVAGAAWEEWSWGRLGLPGFRWFCSSLWENFKEQELLSILTIQSATI